MYMMKREAMQAEKQELNHIASEVSIPAK